MDHGGPGDEWQVELRGEASDIEAFTDAATRWPGVRIVDQRGKSWLCSSTFDPTLGVETMILRAARLIGQLNGLAVTLDEQHRPVEAGATELQRSDGTRARIGLIGPLGMRIRLGKLTLVIGGEAIVDERTLVGVEPEKLQAFAEALWFLGRSANWYDLYKAYEVVRDAAGGGTRLERKGWVTKSTLNAFTLTANYGPEGRHLEEADRLRHARISPMSLEQGLNVVRSLVQGWWRELVGSHVNHPR